MAAEQSKRSHKKKNRSPARAGEMLMEKLTPHAEIAPTLAHLTTAIDLLDRFPLIVANHHSWLALRTHLYQLTANLRWLEAHYQHQRRCPVCNRRWPKQPANVRPNMKRLDAQRHL